MPAATRGFVGHPAIFAKQNGPSNVRIAAEGPGSIPAAQRIGMLTGVGSFQFARTMRREREPSGVVSRAK